MTLSLHGPENESSVSLAQEPQSKERKEPPVELPVSEGKDQTEADFYFELLMTLPEGEYNRHSERTAEQVKEEHDISLYIKNLRRGIITSHYSFEELIIKFEAVYDRRPIV